MPSLRRQQDDGHGGPLIPLTSPTKAYSRLTSHPTILVVEEHQFPFEFWKDRHYCDLGEDGLFEEHQLGGASLAVSFASLLAAIFKSPARGVAMVEPNSRGVKRKGNYTADPATRYPLPATHYPLPATYYLLPATPTCYQLPPLPHYPTRHPQHSRIRSRSMTSTEL
jgi:hypothetical protein